jgi:uncharacterized 2Fe-2S/4Fe-4S cluster protein (DUF4445 family)
MCPRKKQLIFTIFTAMYVHHARGADHGMKKATITVKPSGLSREFDGGVLLLDALAEMGILLRTPCGGRGFCGKCAVTVRGELPPRTEAEDRLYPGEPHRRLACQTRISGDVAVHHEYSAVSPALAVIAPGADEKLGLAVDVGTTTIQVSLTNMSAGSSALLDSFLNPQRRFGHDVIARISAATSPGDARALTDSVRWAVTGAALAAMGAAGVSPGRIERIVFSGNTTMLYFLYGLDVRPIGVYPYLAATRDFGERNAAEIGLGDFPNATVHALPVASAYLGGDLVGGLSLTHQRAYERRVFFLDMGTNGEIFVRNGDGVIYATSCAMGPALEGMNISHGMTADAGAVSHVRDGGRSLVLQVIGQGAPVGLCGTGIIDLLALMLRERVIRSDGAFMKIGRDEHRLFPDGVLSSGGTKMIRLDGAITLSQKDIRNIQLAKGASLSASNILLHEARCRVEDVEHVFIAGAFGENLSIENFRALSFIPDFPNARYHFLGNTSLAAAQEACLSGAFRESARRLRDSINVVELSSHPDFNGEFVRCLDF